MPLPPFTPSQGASAAAPPPTRSVQPFGDPLDVDNGFSLASDVAPEFDSGEATVVLSAPPPPLSAGFRGTYPSIQGEPSNEAADGDLEFDPSTPSDPKPPSAAPPPSMPAPSTSPPRVESTDPALELLDLSDGSGPDAEPLPSPPGGVERFSVRSRAGKVSGPFEAATVLEKLAEKQLLGDEEVSTDGTTWAPIGSVAAFARAIEAKAQGDKVHGGSETSAAQRPGPPGLFGGRMAAPAAMQEKVDLREAIVTKIAKVKDSLPEGARARSLPIAVGAAVALFLGAGLVLELATPYGFWFRRPILGFPAADEDTEFARLLEGSKSFIEADNYAAARKALELAETALGSEPKNPRAQARYAMAAYSLELRYRGHAQQVDRARAYLDALAPLGSRDADVLKALAVRALYEGDAGRARTLTDEVLSRNPEDREALALSAEALLVSRDAAGANAKIQQLLALAPNGPRALHLRGLAQLSSDPEAAAASFAAALAADPHHVSSALELADLALRVKRDRATAASTVERILAPEGIDSLGGLQLARAWAIQGTLKALAHEPVEAQKAFDVALQASGDSLPARLAYGWFLVGRRSYEKAAEVLRPVYERAPQDIDVVEVWAQALLGVRRYLEVDRIAQNLVAARPNDARGLMLRGEVQLRMGKAKEAEKTFAAAAAKNPRFAAPLVALGRYHLSEGQLEKARTEIDAALALAPADPEVQTALGEWCLVADALDEALASFDAALALDPDHAAAHLGRARTLEAQGDLAGALVSSQAAVTINEVIPQHRDLLGQLLWRQAEADGTIAPGELDGALAELRKALLLDPKNARHAAHLGAVQLRSGQVGEALKTLQDAVEIDPSDAEARLWLARTALEEKNMPLALEAIRAAIRIDGKNPEYFYQFGLIFEANSNPVDALEAFKQAVDLSPKHADALEHLAKNQALLNGLADAVKNYEAALAVDPSRARVLLAIGDVHLKAGQWEKAIARFRQALQRDPTLVGAHALLGRAYDEKGNRAKAEAEYRLSTQKDPTNAIAFRQLAYSLKERGKIREALGLFRKYLELEPAASDRADIEDEIATLSAAY